MPHIRQLPKTECQFSYCQWDIIAHEDAPLHAGLSVYIISSTLCAITTPHLSIIIVARPVSHIFFQYITTAMILRHFTSTSASSPVLTHICVIFALPHLTSPHLTVPLCRSLPLGTPSAWVHSPPPSSLPIPPSHHEAFPKCGCRPVSPSGWNNAIPDVVAVHAKRTLMCSLCRSFVARRSVVKWGPRRAGIGRG